MIPDPQFVSFLPQVIYNSVTVTRVYANNVTLPKFSSKAKAACDKTIRNDWIVFNKQIKINEMETICNSVFTTLKQMYSAC